MDVSIQEIKTSYGEEQAKLLNELFDLGQKARQVEVSLDGEVRESLDARDLNRIKAAQGAVWAEGERERLKTRYEEIELEMRAAIEEAVAEAERELSPREVSAEAVLRASTMSEQELIDAMDSALGLGDAGEDAARLCFQMARQKDYERAVAHAIDVREDWSETYLVIVEGSSQPDVDPGSRFELLAQSAPSKQDILRTPQSDANVYGQHR